MRFLPLILLAQSLFFHVQLSQGLAEVRFGSLILQAFCIQSPSTVSKFLGVRLSSTRTDAAAHAIPILTFPISAAPILNSLGASKPLRITFLSLIRFRGQEMLLS